MGGTWQKGMRFSSGASTSEIKKWTDCCYTIDVKQIVYKKRLKSYN